jgi:hypothetical protein
MDQLRAIHFSGSFSGGDEDSHSRILNRPSPQRVLVIVRGRRRPQLPD